VNRGADAAGAHVENRKMLLYNR